MAVTAEPRVINGVVVNFRAWSDRHQLAIQRQEESCPLRPVKSPAPSACRSPSADAAAYGQLPRHHPVQTLEPGPLSHFVGTRPCAAMFVILLVPLFSMAIVAFLNSRTPLYLDINVDYQLPEFAPAQDALRAASAYSYDNQRLLIKSSQFNALAADDSTTPGSVASESNLLIVFHAPNGNILSKDKLERVRQVEQHILGNEAFAAICRRDRRGLCMQPQSLTRILFASEAASNGDMVYDGRAETMMPISQALDTAFRLKLWSLFDRLTTATNPVSSTLVSVFSVGLPLPGYASPDDRAPEQEHRIASELLPAMEPFLRTLSMGDVRVLYTGGNILRDEVLTTIWKDLRLVAVSVAFVFTWMLIIERSIFLAICGTMSLLIAFAPTLAIYMTIFEGQFSLLALSSLWILLGIIADDFFVYREIWRQSIDVVADKSDYPTRLRWTMSHAILALFMTSSITIVGFLSNCTSNIRPIQQFGMFLGTLVLVAFFVAITWNPVVNVIYDKYFAHWCTRRRHHPSAIADEAAPAPLLNTRESISSRIMGAYANFLNKHRWGVMFLFLGFSTYMAYRAQKLSTPTSPTQILHPDSNFEQLRLISANVMQSCDACFNLPPPGKPAGGARGSGVAPAPQLANTTTSRSCPADFAGRVCSGHGQCKNGTNTCDCSYGYIGAACDYRCNINCGGGERGTCELTNGIEFCNCREGFAGAHCEYSCPKGCSKAGTCNFPNPFPPLKETLSPSCTRLRNKCIANPDTSVFSCSDYFTAGCPAAAICPDAWMACRAGVSKPACAFLATANCQVVVAPGITGTCACDNGFFGGACELKCPGMSGAGAAPCSGHGSCQMVQNAATKANTTTCTCNDDWAGPGCELPPAAGTKPPVLSEQDSVKAKLLWGVAGTTARGSNDGLDPVWDPHFNLTSEHVQTFFSRVCERIRQQTTSWVRPGGLCLMRDFEQFARDTKRGFPVPSDLFNVAMLEFLQLPTSTIHFRNIGLDPQAHRITFLRVDITTNTPSESGATMVAGAYERVQDLIDSLNGESVVQGLQTSTSWNRMGLEESIIHGTLQNVQITVLTAAVSLLFFTRSIRVAVMGTLSAALIFVVIAGMFVVLGWTVGVVEAVSLSMLIGLCVDFQLHITHTYRSAPGVDRTAKMITTLKTVGCSVIWSSISTVGSTGVLMLCQVRIFDTFGAIVALDGLVGSVFAIGFLSACLFIAGPVNNPKLAANTEAESSSRNDNDHLAA